MMTSNTMYAVKGLGKRNLRLTLSSFLSPLRSITTSYNFFQYLFTRCFSDETTWIPALQTMCQLGFLGDERRLQRPTLKSKKMSTIKVNSFFLSHKFGSFLGPCGYSTHHTYMCRKPPFVSFNALTDPSLFQS